MEGICVIVVNPVTFFQFLKGRCHGRYSTKMRQFFGRVYLMFTNEQSQLWSYWTKFHEIFTRYRGIIYAVNAHIAVVISHSVLEWQSDKCRG